MRELSKIEQMNAEYLAKQNIEFAFLLPTPTGLQKSIMDAIAPLRDFLHQKSLHDYSTQTLGLRYY